TPRRKRTWRARSGGGSRPWPRGWRHERAHAAAAARRRAAGPGRAVRAVAPWPRPPGDGAGGVHRPAAAAGHWRAARQPPGGLLVRGAGAAVVQPRRHGRLERPVRARVRTAGDRACDRDRAAGQLAGPGCPLRPRRPADLTIDATAASGWNVRHIDGRKTRMEELVIVTTGATTDKVYFDDKSGFQAGEPPSGRILEELGV